MTKPANTVASSEGNSDRPWVVRLHWPLALVAVYALAAPLRLMLLDGPLYGDEAVQYAMSRHWGDDPDNVVPEYNLNGPLWWGRMMFPLVLSPGAALGIMAFRVEHALLASLLPVLVAGVARRAGLHPFVALGAGLAVATHPLLVMWGARVFPDTIMACFVMAALWAHVARRPFLAAALFVAAVWTKETAGLALAAVFAWSLWKGRRAGLLGVWPLRLDQPTTALLGACLLAPWPLVYAVFGLQGRVPGWSEFPLEWHHLSDLFATAWLILPILAGLVWSRSLPWSALALVYPAFYVTYGLMGRGIEGWYLVLPIVLAILGAAVALQTGTQQATPSIRSASRVGTVVVVAMLVAIALVPSSLAAKQVTTPAAKPPLSLIELERELRGDDLFEAVDHIRADQWGTVFLVDPGWYNVHYPFAERAGTVGQAYTVIDVAMEEWTRAVENADVTVLLKVDHPLNRALRDTYADCEQFENDTYVLIDGTSCSGRTERLGQEFQWSSLDAP